MTKAASSMPPAVKPAGHKTSGIAAEVLRQLERTPGRMAPEVEEAARNLGKALEQQNAQMAQQLEMLRERLPPSPPPPVAPPSQSGDNDDMEHRIKALELFALDARERLVRLETKIDATATREDLHKEVGAQTWRIVGAMLTIGAAMSAAVFFIARNVT